MLYRNLFLILCSLCLAPQTKAQNFTADFIKTVSLKTNNSNNLNPIIELGDSIYISFDDLEADQKNYYYTIEHCSYNWEISDIITTEYIEGYASYEIQDFKNSFNTLQQYTHHYFQLPNENTRIKISGNYLLSILNEEDEICIQRKFVVYEPLVIINAKTIRDRTIKNVDKKQVVQFSVFHPEFKIDKPSEDLKIKILQNNDWNFSLQDIQPKFYKKNEIIYKHHQKTSFFGGNEFLNFDSKDLTSANIYIARTTLKEKLYHTYLYTTNPRVSYPYTFYPDINGGFHIRTLNGFDQSIESDYSWVHFSLETNSAAPTKENVFVYGAFNNYAANKENQLIFNERTQLLEATLLLKQGFYNYTYVTKNENNQLEKRQINGSFYETENSYILLAYYKSFGHRTDRIIGMTTIHSNSL